MAKGIPTSSCTPCIDCSHQHILVPALTSSCTPRVDCSHADICTSRFDILHTSPCTPYVDCSPVARIVLVESTIRLHPALRSSPAHARPEQPSQIQTLTTWFARSDNYSPQRAVENGGVQVSGEPELLRTLTYSSFASGAGAYPVTLALAV